jgi:RNA polymerase sigma-70 factor, ECF subfamily
MFSILVNQAKTHYVRERRALPLSSVIRAQVPEPAVPADRFQSDDDAWPGHWATPPRPWQRPERRLLSLEARDRLRDALGCLPERQRLTRNELDGQPTDARVRPGYATRGLVGR